MTDAFEKIKSQQENTDREFRELMAKIEKLNEESGKILSIPLTDIKPAEIARLDAIEKERTGLFAQVKVIIEGLNS